MFRPLSKRNTEKRGDNYSSCPHYNHYQLQKFMKTSPTGPKMEVLALYWVNVNTYNKLLDERIFLGI